MKKIQRLCCIFLICFIVLATIPMSVMASSEQNIEEKINAMVQEHMDKAKITSVSIAYVQNGELTFCLMAKTLPVIMHCIKLALPQKLTPHLAFYG